MHIHFIEHAPFENPGYIDTWIKSKNFTSSSTSLYKGESLPSQDSFDFLIIMGGPQSPTDLIQFPYLADEILFAKTTIEKNKPILGICLGAQIIGEALGAKTLRSPHKEVGTFPISLTLDGLHDPIFKHFPEQFDVMHWHNDMPGVPHGAAILAESDGCPRQVVRYKKNVYGLQCHMEMTHALVTGMLDHCKDDLQPSVYTQNAEEMLETNFAEMNEKLHFILDRMCEET